jgi:rare lipoprotein A (peptidoglycan hydrolase)
MTTLKAAAWLAVLCLVALPAQLVAETYWEGSAARIREGEIAEPGLLAASNTFPRDTRIRVTNRATGKSETLTVVKRIDRATSVMILVTAEAAEKLGIGATEIVAVRIAVAGEQGLGVGTRPAELPLSQDPDINPSVRAPAAKAAAAPATPPAASSAAESATAQPTAEPQKALGDQQPATAEPVAKDADNRAATPAEPAAAAASATAKAPEGAVGIPQAASEPAAQAAPVADTAGAIRPKTESPAAAAAAGTPVELPPSSAQRESEFLERISARVPEKRVFAPARGADVPDPVFAEEAPVVMVEAAPPSGIAPAAGPTALDQPALAAAAETPASAQPGYASGSPAPAGPPDEGKPFVQTERPDTGVAPARPVPASAPELPPLRLPERAEAMASAQPSSAAPARAEVVPPAEEHPFVQTEQPTITRAAVAVAAVAPQAPPEQVEPEERAFVQQEQPRAGAATRIVAAPVPQAPPERALPADAAFVQAERPAASAAAPAVESVPPSAELSGFVQVEPVGAQSTLLALAPSAPRVPAEERGGSGMVQVEQPEPDAADVAVEATEPQREGALEVMSVVDSPAQTRASPELARADAALPSEPARTAQPAQASAARPTEVAVAVPAAPTLSAAAQRGVSGGAPTLTPAAPSSAARTSAPSAGGATPAAQLAAAVAREGLPLDAYYLQVAAVGSEKLAKELVTRLAPKYPSWVIPPDTADREVYRVLVGPLAADERGAVLYQFRTGGYSDAFIRYLN